MVSTSTSQKAYSQVTKDAFKNKQEWRVHIFYGKRSFSKKSKRRLPDNLFKTYVAGGSRDTGMNFGGAIRSILYRSHRRRKFKMERNFPGAQAHWPQEVTCIVCYTHIAIVVRRNIHSVLLVPHSNTLHKYVHLLNNQSKNAAWNIFSLILNFVISMNYVLEIMQKRSTALNE